jgi:Sugar (and other) transporter
MVWLFVVHFGYSWGPCAWIIVAEIWPLSNRPYGIALGASSNWMNNFIVGQVSVPPIPTSPLQANSPQVTPDMISGISYGTYLIFGILTFGGAAFVWFFVPETKRLTLEEMDVIFGSEGTAQADFERMEEINKEIGLDTLLRGAGSGGNGAAMLEEKEASKEGSEKEHHLETTEKPQTTSPEVTK